MLLAGDAQPRLRDEIAERERREQPFALAQKMGAGLLDHDFERRVIRSQVMRTGSATAIDPIAGS